MTIREAIDALSRLPDKSRELMIALNGDIWGRLTIDKIENDHSTAYVHSKKLEEKDEQRN